MKNKKAFTLIELVSVLVILAILALIVTPLVLNIIRKARTAADKRSIDAYGRSIELAIADYLLDNGTFPTSIEELTVEYSGDRVSCTTTQLNADSSVYLAGCTVGNRAVEGYTYGKEQTVTYDAYSVGDEVTYNNVEYYVIKDSGASESSVTLLKAEPLKYEEVQGYELNIDIDVEDNNNYAIVKYGLTKSYETSYVKFVVDAWALSNNKPQDILNTRLILFEELINNLGYNDNLKQCTGSCWYENDNETPYWIYSNNYSYWILNTEDDSTSTAWAIRQNGYLDNGNGLYYKFAIRPVIELKKIAIN